MQVETPSLLVHSLELLCSRMAMVLTSRPAFACKRLQLRSVIRVSRHMSKTMCSPRSGQWVGPKLAINDDAQTNLEASQSFILYYTPGMRPNIYSANPSLAREISEQLEPEMVGWMVPRQQSDITPRGRRSITASASPVGLLCVTPRYDVRHNPNDALRFLVCSSIASLDW